MMSRLAQWMLVLPGEGRAVVYLVLLNFLIGIGMTVGNTSSDALFFKRLGVEYMPHMLILSSLLLVVFSTIYAGMADKINASTLTIRMLGTLVVVLFLLWLSVRMGGGKVAILGYFLCYAIVSELLLAHMSLYCLSFFDATQSRRLLPLISAGQRLGAVIGGVLVSVLLSFLATEDMMLVWIIALILTVSMVVHYHRHDPMRRRATRSRESRGKGMFSSVLSGLAYARTSRLLQLTGAGVFVLVMIYSVQDYLVSTIFTRQFENERSLAEFLGWFYAAVNATALLLQILFTSRILRRFGLNAANMVFPVSSFFSFSLLALSPTLIPAMIGRLNYAGIMRAFRHPTYELYFHGFPAYMQGRARSAIVGFFVPVAFAFSGITMMMVPEKYVTLWLGWVGVALALLYILIEWKKHQAYEESLSSLIKKQVFSPADGAIQEMGRLDAKIFDSIVASLRETSDEASAMAYLEVLSQGSPDKYGSILLEISPQFSDNFQDKFLRKIAELRPVGWQAYARSCLSRGDGHLSSTALVVLLEEAESPEWILVEQWLKKTTAPRLRGTAIQVVLSGSDPLLKRHASNALKNMLGSSNTSELKAGLAVVRDLVETQWQEMAKNLLTHDEASVRVAAVKALGSLCSQSSGVAQILRPAFHDASPLVRAAAVTILGGVNNLPLQVDFLSLAAHDPEFEVRRAVELFVGNYESPGNVEFLTVLHNYFDDFEMQRLILGMAAKGRVDEWRLVLGTALKRNMDAAAEKKSLVFDIEFAMTKDKLIDRLPAQFIIEVLEEEIHRHLDMGLYALELMDEGRGVSAIRAAWASSNRHLRSLALESLRNEENDDNIRRMLQLLEAQLSNNWQEIITTDASRSWQEALNKCLLIGSVWLKQCVCELAPDLLHEQQKPC